MMDLRNRSLAMALIALGITACDNGTTEDKDTETDTEVVCVSGIS